MTDAIRWNEVDADDIKVDIVLALATKHQVERLSKQQKALIDNIATIIEKSGKTPYIADNSEYWKLIDEAVTTIAEDIVQEWVDALCNAPKAVLEIRLAMYREELANNPTTYTERVVNALQDAIAQ